MLGSSSRSTAVHFTSTAARMRASKGDGSGPAGSFVAFPPTTSTSIRSDCWISHRTSRNTPLSESSGTFSSGLRTERPGLCAERELWDVRWGGLTQRAVRIDAVEAADNQPAGRDLGARQHDALAEHRARPEVAAVAHDHGPVQAGALTDVGLGPDQDR